MSEHTNYRSSKNSYVKILDKNEKIRCLVKNSRTYVNRTREEKNTN